MYLISQELLLDKFFKALRDIGFERTVLVPGFIGGCVSPLWSSGTGPVKLYDS